MASYCYEAVDPGGVKISGTLEVNDQSEALRRIKDMGLFPTKIVEAALRRRVLSSARRQTTSAKMRYSLTMPVCGGRVKPSALAVLTRQLATLVEAGMPLLRGLRTLHEQEENHALKRILEESSAAIEGGSSLSEALATHPKVFNSLYLNMVKAGELGGALEITLRRLAEFMEKAQSIKRKIKAAMFYPVAVMIVAAGILGLMMVYIVPKFQQVFDGLLNGAPLPPLTAFVMTISEATRAHCCLLAGCGAVCVVLLATGLRTKWGRWWLDRLKLAMPLFGPVFRKAAISRFARTLGTLLNSGVPVLQALLIVRETAGNVIVANVISKVHDSVKEGETISVPLKASGVFPAMIAGMVDVGEQTGALPDLLMKIADNYDDEVDAAVVSMTALLEPILIVLLAVIVGLIVIAMFLPILYVINGGLDGTSAGGV